MCIQKSKKSQTRTNVRNEAGIISLVRGVSSDTGQIREYSHDPSLTSHSNLNQSLQELSVALSADM